MGRPQECQGSRDGTIDLERDEKESRKARLEGKHETEHEEQHKYDRASNSQKLTKEVIGNRQTNDYMILIIGMFFQVKYTTDKGRRNLETRHYNRDVLTAMDNDINNLSEDKRRPTYG